MQASITCAEDIEARWQQLNPVFVRGMQRSGTSIMGRALRQMGILGFGEGHLWYELLKPVTQLRNPNYSPNYREDDYALGQGRLFKLEKYIAVALDQFHRDSLPAHPKRWMDKSPGADAVYVVPLLADFFPQAQFIFLHRNGITCVESGVKFWSDDPDIFYTMCQGWAETMSAWRRVRDGLEGRYIEIAQEDIAANPFEIAALLTDFLDEPLYYPAVASLLASQRVLSSFPGKRPRDYNYRIDWSPHQREFFVETCGEEMEAWGYEIDFDSPGRDQNEVEMLAQRDVRILELERECQELRAHLAKIEQGRVMRVLNWLSGVAERFRPRRPA